MKISRELLPALFEFASSPPKVGFDVEDWGEYWVVVFRPTEGSWWSWLWNFFVAPFGGIHQGFGLIYMGLANRVLKVLEIRERRTEERRKVIFTGFSRGGALAEICAVDPAFSPWDPVAVSFGAPKWTTQHVQAPNVVRVEAGGDVVCRVPPWPYRRVGEVVRLRWRWLPSFKAHRYSAYREALAHG